MFPSPTLHRHRTHILHILQVVAAGSLALLSLPLAQAAAGPKPITLLEPLPNGVSAIPVGTGACGSGACPLDALNAYLNPFLPWVIGIAAGISVLMIIFGGFEIMLSNGDAGKITNGKQRIIASLIGLGFLVFSATILNLLNASYYILI